MAASIERMWRHIAPVPFSGCWIWTASCTHDGYALVKHGKHSIVAHRVMYELTRGKIPAGMTLDHLCRVRCCVNPNHVEPVTSRVNTLRGESLSAIHAAKTHCIHGHEFTSANTYIWHGKRICRACGRLANRRARLARLSRQSGRSQT